MCIYIYRHKICTHKIDQFSFIIDIPGPSQYTYTWAKVWTCTQIMRLQVHHVSFVQRISNTMIKWILGFQISSLSKSFGGSRSISCDTTVNMGLLFSVWIQYILIEDFESQVQVGSLQRIHIFQLMWSIHLKTRIDHPQNYPNWVV